MKNKIIFFVLLFFPFWISAQTELNTDILIQRMKLNYQEWLSKRAVEDLLVEYDPSPVALDTPNPRFSWTMDLQGRGRMQSAYQILVASDRKALDAGEGDMWDTGLVESDQSAQITYYGFPLESNREYLWKVRIRDESGSYLFSVSQNPHPK